MMQGGNSAESGQSGRWNAVDIVTDVIIKVDQLHTESVFGTQQAPMQHIDTQFRVPGQLRAQHPGACAVPLRVAEYALPCQPLPATSRAVLTRTGSTPALGAAHEHLQPFGRRHGNACLPRQVGGTFFKITVPVQAGFVVVVAQTTIQHQPVRGLDLCMSKHAPFCGAHTVYRGIAFNLFALVVAADFQRQIHIAQQKHTGIGNACADGIGLDMGCRIGWHGTAA